MYLCLSSFLIRIFLDINCPQNIKEISPKCFTRRGGERETPTHTKPNMAKQVQFLKFLSSHNNLAFKSLYFRLDQQSYMLGVSQINQVQARSLFSTTNYLTLFLDKGWCTYGKQLALHHTSSYTKHNKAY